LIEVTLTNKQRHQQAYALGHHANRLDVMHARLIQRITLSTAAGELTSWGEGPNSVVLYMNGEPQGWYFAGRPNEGAILVRYGGPPRGRFATYTLRTRKDVDKVCDEIGI
jgi:hypothetical protein